MRDVRVQELTKLWLPVVFWCGVIFWLSAIPNLRFTQDWWDYPLRKMAHMVEYGVLARLLARALTGTTYWSWKQIFIGSLIFTILYSITDEIHQRYVSSRHGNPVDLVFDALGAWLALGLKP